MQKQPPSTPDLFADLRAKVPKLDQQRADTCQICQNACRFLGAVDFCVSGNDNFEGRRMFPFSGVPIAHHQCGTCGFVTAPAFFAFDVADFRRFVYNDDYILADPPFAEERPKRNSVFCAEFFRGFEKTARFLDYGGGDGHLARLLRAQGFSVFDSVDPIYSPVYGANAQEAGARYDVITSFEVMEHVPDQQYLMREVARYLKNDGAFVFSTLPQPLDFAAQGLNWRYIMPRNGHLSFHTEQSLKMLLAQHGYTFYQRLAEDLHMAAKPGSPWIKRLAQDETRTAPLQKILNPEPPYKSLPARW